MSSGWPKDLLFILIHRSMLNETELAKEGHCALACPLERGECAHDVAHPVTMTSVPIPGFELAGKMAQLHQERFGGDGGKTPGQQPPGKPSKDGPIFHQAAVEAGERRRPG